MADTAGLTRKLDLLLDGVERYGSAANFFESPRDDLGLEGVKRRVFGERIAGFELQLARVVPDP